MTNVTSITEDGIEPEITEIARKCIDATDGKIKWQSLNFFRKSGDTIQFLFFAGGWRIKAKGLWEYSSRSLKKVGKS
jgi:hypothetical protein